MKKILAVSGGIDSMVLMHMMYKTNPEELIVAHFDHGIRSNSAEDYAFVKREAEKLNLKFVGMHANLGLNCSEDKARAMRYEFLQKCATEYNGEIYTAHHADDAIESITINILRGTGWRGLAPMQNNNIKRPLLKLSKTDIYKYAAEHQLSFRQDQTNSDDKYLRNRIREWLIGLDKEKSAKLKASLLEKYIVQCRIAEEIKEILAQVEQKPTYSRQDFENIDDDIAAELLRQILSYYSVSLTRPQLARALTAIRTYRTSSKFSLNKNNYLAISRHTFYILPL